MTQAQPTADAVCLLSIVGFVALMIGVVFLSVLLEMWLLGRNRSIPEPSEYFNHQIPPAS
jgi:hypothetical protein